MTSTLKLLILYDATNNRYTVLDHNLSPEVADKQVAEWHTKSLLAIAVTQRAPHRTSDPQTCRACRRDVERASGLTPKPRFERRKDQ